MSISFFTKAWSGDWGKLAAGGFERKWQSIGYEFDVVGIALNNGLPEGAEQPFMGKADLILRVERMAAEVLAEYGLAERDFKGGYVYSIAELSCIQACDTDYLCYVQGDCLCTSGDWVTEGIAVLESEPMVSVVSPGSDVNTWHNQFGLDQFFSDQAWLVRTEEFKSKLLMAGGPDIKEYPAHGGDSFEKKAAQYLRSNGKYRKILANHRYEHPAV